MRTKSDMLIVQDPYNPTKKWRVRRYRCGTYYVNQLINGRAQYARDTRMTAGNLKALFPAMALSW
jgi:hypothetical protein